MTGEYEHYAKQPHCSACFGRGFITPVALDQPICTCPRCKGTKLEPIDKEPIHAYEGGFLMCCGRRREDAMKEGGGPAWRVVENAKEATRENGVTCLKCLHQYAKGLRRATLRGTRLLGAMHYGCVVTYGDGHRWLYSMLVDELEDSVDGMLRKKGLPVMRSKVYGTIDDALDRIDGALKVLGLPSLEKTYDPVMWGLVEA